MTSYLVYSPPGDKPLDIRFVADRFSWLAFVFPAFWLLFKRQWLAGIAAIVVQAVIAATTDEPHLLVAGLLAELALRLLVALEGPRFVASRLEVAGWTLHAVIPAPDLDTAEAMYDSRPAGTDTPTPSLKSTENGKAGTPAFGLFETYGER
ncbi:MULTISPECIES: DUF2628 domain-containing protein [unclassified Rhizobium]|uniref:DUF2628 domain-containing protein n=1 Tax=unclassified Rhizobium TaxID=2613769 RepID=UPI000700A403|nr:MULTISPECIES: DUF2628 domain-containing protein [unclassified Rhizobium]KQV35876.1 hypothetical protein ASC86_11870 [Rhizobium sp. Root1212]KRD25982.1 hypothetical protein ASE37_11865 [Rhizobium sp. Root268]